MDILKTFVQTISALLLMLIAPASFSQNVGDTTDGRFNNQLLNHLVGKWDVEAIVHDEKFTIDLEAEWVMNHQYLHIHLKSREVVHWLKVPYESEFFFGYNRSNKRYTVHEMSVFGDDGPYEGFCYGYQAGNEFKIVKKWAGSDTLTIQRFTWKPDSKSWHIDMRQQIDGKEAESIVFMKLKPITASSN